MKGLRDSRQRQQQARESFQYEQCPTTQQANDWEKSEKIRAMTRYRTAVTKALFLRSSWASALEEQALSKFYLSGPYRGGLWLLLFQTQIH
jgi:hypothetical protein